MSSPTDRIIALIINHLEQNITEAERRELGEWMNESSVNKEAVDTFLEEQKLQEGVRDMYQIRQKVWDRLQKQLDIAKVVPLRHPSTPLRIWWRYAAAAAIIILLGVGSYFLFVSKTNNQQQAISKEPTHDVKAPQTNRAMITLANGEKVFLDSVNSGQLAMQEQVRIVKLTNGEVAYQTEAKIEVQKIIYNTLSNPRGSLPATITLSDGTKVWLNAGSSLTYPIAFAGNERKVSITGEAYFEVAHDPSMPFKVGKGDMEVTVVGTHFNVNAYDDEASIKVTLMEGLVKVSQIINHESKFINPGQQAKLVPGEAIEIKTDIDLEGVMAWKNGLFLLDNTDLPTIMRQISRWYDVDVVFEGKMTDRRFGGGVSKNLPLSKVMELLEANGLHSRLEGKKLIMQL